MNQFVKVFGTVAGLAMSNITTFYLGFEMASNECKECNLDFRSSFKDNNNSK